MLTELAARLEGLVDRVGERELAIAAVVVAVILFLVANRRSGRGRRPAEGEVWFAEVPFSDGTGSKDRPVLVLRAGGGTCLVARFTSKDRGDRSDHRHVPGVHGLRRDTWVNLRPITLPRRAFRRRVAAPDPALVLWFARESGWSEAT